MNPTTAEIVAYLRGWAKQEEHEAAKYGEEGWEEFAHTLREYARGLTEAANEIEARW